jgi:hypothetical protein
MAGTFTPYPRDPTRAKGTERRSQDYLGTQKHQE